MEKADGDMPSALRLTSIRFVTKRQEFFVFLLTSGFVYAIICIDNRCIAIRCIKEENMKIGKELLKGSTSMMILKVLLDGDSYGYEIVQRLAQRSEGVFQLNEGTLYPILHTLEKEGYLDSYRKESRAGRERKYYRVTAAGKLYLAARVEEWETFSSSVSGVLFGEA